MPWFESGLGWAMAMFLRLTLDIWRPMWTLTLHSPATLQLFKHLPSLGLSSPDNPLYILHPSKQVGLDDFPISITVIWARNSKISTVCSSRILQTIPFWNSGVQWASPQGQKPWYPGFDIIVVGLAGCVSLTLLSKH